MTNIMGEVTPSEKFERATKGSARILRRVEKDFPHVFKDHPRLMKVLGRLEDAIEYERIFLAPYQARKSNR